jgi:hypothetical protein
MKLYTGGKAFPNRQNLFVLNGGAAEVTYPNPPASTSPPWFGWPVDVPIPPEQIQIGNLGKLGNDWRLYTVLKNDVTEDVTPIVRNKGYYKFDVQHSKHKLWIKANGAVCNYDELLTKPTFIVGEYVTFSYDWDTDPPAIQSATNKWELGGNYKNDETNVVVGGQMPNSSDFYFPNTNFVTEEWFTSWWVSGGFPFPKAYPAKLEIGLTFNNGQYVHMTENGAFNMYRPTSAVSTATGTVALDGNFNYFGLHDGKPIGLNGIPGITLTNLSTIPSGYSGTFQWVQVINSFLFRYQKNDGSEGWKRAEGGGGLDGGYPYSGNPSWTEDSPGISIDGPPYVAKYMSAFADFNIWLEFKPSGGHWVPLRVVNWRWSGEGSLSGSTWTLIDSSNPVISNEDTEDYATWTHIIYGGAPDWQDEP